MKFKKIDEDKFNDVCEFIVGKKYDEVNEDLVESLIEYIDCVHKQISKLQSNQLESDIKIRRLSSQIDILWNEVYLAYKYGYEPTAIIKHAIKFHVDDNIREKMDQVINDE